MLMKHFTTVRALTGMALTVLAGALSFAQGSGPRDNYVHIAEGLTSATKLDGIRAEFRMFSTPDMPTHCAQARTVRRLSATTRSVRLLVGRLFPLSMLKVVALGPAGEIIPRVPIAIEVQSVSPAALDLQSDHLELGPVPIRPGMFQFRIRTVCDGPGAATLIKARVVR